MKMLIFHTMTVASYVKFWEVTTDTPSLPDAIQIKGSVCHSNGRDLV